MEQPNRQPTVYGIAILTGLGNPSKHVYGGTVDYWTVRERRARNKRARQARRANRR